MDRDRVVHTLMQNSPDLIAWFGPDLAVLDANDAFWHALGIEGDRTAPDWAAPMDFRLPAEWAAVLRQVFDTGKSLQVPVSYSLRGGEQRHIDALLVPDLGSDGISTAVLLSGRDITSHVQAQQRSEAAERRYRAFVDATASVVWRRSADGRATLQLQPGDLMAEDPLDVNAESWPEQIHPDDWALTEAAWEDALRNRRPFLVEHRSRMPDGQYRWFQARAVPVLDATGEVQEWVGASTDVTEQKEVEERLAATQGRFESLVHHSMEAITLLAADGTVVYQTPSIRRLLGYEPEMLLGRNIFEFVHPEDIPPLTQVFGSFVKGSPEQRTRFRLRSGAGQWRWFEAVGTNLLHDPGVRAIVINSRDVTEQIETQQQIEESELKYRALIERAGQLVYDYDIEDGTIRWSGNIPGITGHTPEEFAAINIDAWSERLHPDDKEQAERLLAESIRDLSPFEAAYRFRHADGSYRHIEEKGIFLPLKTAGKARMVGTMADVTDRVEAQRQIRESEVKYRALVEQSGQLVYDYEIEGGAIWWSGNILDITGHTPEAFAAMGIDAWSERLHPEDREQTLALLEIALRDGTPFEASYRFRHASGTYRHIEDRGVLLPRRTGEKTRMAGTMSDVTERVVSAEALRHSESRYRSISQLISAYAFAYKVDEAGQLHSEWFTETVRDVLGISVEEIMSAPTGSLTHPDDLSTWQARNEALLNGHERTVELRMRHRDGSYRWVRTYSFPAQDESGRVVRIYGAAQDVTSQKEAEAQIIEAKDRAEEMSRLKDAFLANMSHEIRTPLTSILGFTDLLRDLVDEEGREFVDMISLGGRRLKDTLTSVLELSQLQAGRVDLHPVALDVSALVSETTTLLRAQAHENRVTLETACTQSPLWTTLDRSALARILTNLAGNAVKFTGAGGTVTVSVGLDRRGEREVLRLTVADTGIGIAAEFLPHLFDEFRQESVGHSRSYEGAGLGLAIAKRLVGLMGGTISVQSAKGVGTTFTVLLPHQAGAVPAADAAAELAAPVGPRRRVLLVEDEESTRRFVALALRGFRVVDVGSPAEAVAAVAVASEPFDLVLLDIHLGEAKSGEDLLPELREAPSCHQARFIATTAFALPGDEERFLRAGFDGYLAKPFLRTELLGACRDLLSK